MHLLKALASLSTLALAVVAVPTIRGISANDGGRLEARQGRNSGAGKFCDKVSPAPPDDEVRARHEAFADAFLVKKDVRLAFEYIAPEYIVSYSPSDEWRRSFRSGAFQIRAGR